MKLLKKRLGQYRKSDLMNVKITYGGKTYKYNLYEELRIDEAQIERELKTQPSSFAFMSMLHKKLLAEFERLKHERTRIWARLYMRGKNKLNGQRPYSDDMAKAYADAHKEYDKITLDCIQMRENADALYTCVTAFIQRANLLQTISSNKRNENR